jgi:hypothetical protein
MAMVPSDAKESQTYVKALTIGLFTASAHWEKAVIRLEAEWLKAVKMLRKISSSDVATVTTTALNCRYAAAMRTTIFWSIAFPRATKKVSIVSKTAISGIIARYRARAVAFPAAQPILASRHVTWATALAMAVVS